MTKSGQLARIKISLELLEELLLPSTSRIISVHCDNLQRFNCPTVEIVVEDRSFPELKEGDQIPEKMLTHKKVDPRSLREYHD